MVWVLLERLVDSMRGHYTASKAEDIFAHFLAWFQAMVFIEVVCPSTIPERTPNLLQTSKILGWEDLVT